MTPEEETYLGLLIFASIWVLVSVSVLGTIGPEWRWRAAAWLWFASFLAASLTAAYYFWRLL
jgi:hypothetical protein